MQTVQLYADAGIRIAVTGEGNGELRVDRIELAVQGQTAVSFALREPVRLPAAAIDGDRLRRLRAIEGAAAVQAQVRAALQSIAAAPLALGADFLGITGGWLAQASLLLRLDLDAWYASTEAAVQLSGRLQLEGRLSVDAQAVQIDTAASASYQLAVAWLLEIHFDSAGFQVGLALPDFNLDLPRLPLPRLHLPGLAWPTPQFGWRRPAWLEGLALPVDVQATRLSLRMDDQHVLLAAHTLTIHYDGTELLRGKGLQLSTDGSAKISEIVFHTLTLSSGRVVENVLGLGLTLRTGPIKATPRIELDSGSDVIKVTVRLDSLRLQERTGSFVLFEPVQFTWSAAGIEQCKATLKDGAASATLQIAVRDLALKGVQKVRSLAEWTVGVVQTTGAAAGRLLAGLVDFLRRLVLPTPRLPTVGPVGNGFSGLMQQLAKALSEFSVQLVFDRGTRRLHRCLISMRAQPAGVDPLLDFGVPALHTHMSGAQAHMALLVELQGPHAGDWMLLAAPPAASANPWFALTLSSDLWLQQAGGTQLEQDSNDAGKPPEAPLLTCTIKPRAPFSVALFGMQAGHPVFLRAFAFSAAEDPLELDRRGVPQLRLGSASGGYALQPIGLDLLEVGFEFNQAKAGRLLPWLRRPEGDTAPGLVQVRITGYTYAPEQQTLSIALELRLAGKTVANATLSGRWSLHHWRLELADIEVVWRVASPAPEPFEMLGLKWSMKPGPDGALFVLKLGEEPALHLHPQASIAVAVAFDEASGQDLEFTVPKGAFSISRGGISLDARYENPKPVRLAGIETHFQFKAAELRIRDSRVHELQLVGKGALPTWIGDATVDASFRFRMEEGATALQLVSVWAELETPGKKIEAKDLRFEFSLRKIELAWLPDRVDGKRVNKFYFMLSGSAEFKPNGGEFDGGLLQYLKNARIELNRTPITSNTEGMLSSLSFTVPLPKPQQINLFNLFRFEIRSVGFACNVFGKGQHAIQLGGQCAFADLGDVVSTDIDFHALYLGAPAGNNPLPRVKFEGLRVLIKIASRIRIGGTVLAVDRDLPLNSVLTGVDQGLTAKGFVGVGEVEIPGLPALSASFGFLELEQDGRRGRSWFVYIQANKLTYQIPAPIPLYIREIGLGLGYRYTLAAMAVADQAQTPAELIRALDEMARTQGDLARYSAWTPQLEQPGEDPKLTLAMRALLTMASASPPQAHQWNEAKEAQLPCPLTMDIVAGLRSDLTFLMTVRVWLAVNYHDFLNGGANLRTRPLVKGFLYLSAPRQEFMARLASQDQPFIGKHPVVPDLVQRALRSVQYSATLYMRPGLLHFELGWPDQLRWADQFGPLKVSCVGGFVFRMEDAQLLLGVNFSARGQLQLAARAGSDSFGASISALAEVAFTNRLIAVIDARRLQGSMYYGLVAMEIAVRFAVSAWLRFRVFGRTIGMSVGFSFSLQLSVALELVLTGDPDIGGRARCRVGIRAFGRSLGLQVDLAYNGAKVDQARARVARYLSLGLAGPSEYPPDPFGSAAKAQLPPATTGLAAALAPPQAMAAVRGLVGGDFIAWARRIDGRTLGAAGLPPDLVLVCLVPDGKNAGFLCTPPADWDQPVAWDYAWSGLPDKTWIYQPGVGWQANDGPAGHTAVNWAYRLGGDDQLTLALLIDNTFIDLNASRTAAAAGPVYVDPVPRQHAGGQPERVDALSADARGAALRASELLARDEREPDRAANDARDFVLAQLLDSLVELGQSPAAATRTLAPQLGLCLLLPAADYSAAAMQRIQLIRRDLPTVACRVSAAPDTLQVFHDNDDAPAVGFAATEVRQADQRLEFAWDLRWLDADGRQGEPEDHLHAYEVRCEIGDSDVQPRTWLVRPGDNLVCRPDAAGTGQRWHTQRAVRQFVDDFADLGRLPDTDQTLRYSVVALATDGSRSRVLNLATRLVPPDFVAAPCAGQLELQLSQDAPHSLYVPGLAAATLHLELPTPQSAAAAQSVTAGAPQPLADAVELMLRPEPIRPGGSYGIDTDQSSRELLGADLARLLPSDLQFEIALPALGRGDQLPPIALPAGALKTLRDATYAQRGRMAWRVHARLRKGQRYSQLVPLTVHLRAADRRAVSAATGQPPPVVATVAVPAFEYPFAADAPIWRALRGYCGRFVPAHLDAESGRLAAVEGASANVVATVLAWSAHGESAHPPVAEFQLHELAVDALPPRLLDAGSQPLAAAWREQSALLAQLRLCTPELLALQPQRVDGRPEWQAGYAPASAAQIALRWPDPASRRVLPRVEPALLDHLRTSLDEADGLQWPPWLGVRVHPRDERPQGSQDAPPASLRLRATGTLLTAAGAAPDGFNVFRIGNREASEAEMQAALAALQCDEHEPLGARWPFRVEIVPMASADSYRDALVLPVTAAARHPGLIALAEQLATERGQRVEYQPAFEDEATIVTAADLYAANPAAEDPLGFGSLHRLGMAVCVRVWDRPRNRYVPAGDLWRRLRAMLDDPAVAKPDGLVVDVLLQSNRQRVVVPFDDGEERLATTVENAGLAMLQLSLRPRPHAVPQRDIKDWLAVRGWSSEVGTAPPKAWLDRFLEHSVAEGSVPLVPAARTGLDNAQVAPDPAGQVRWILPGNDLYGRVRSYAVRAIGRYDDLLFRVLGQQPAFLDQWQGAPATLHTVRVQRLRPIDPPALVYSGHATLPVPDEQGRQHAVPVWEIAIGRHAEQSLSEASDLLALRLQYRGLLGQLTRRPRDPAWLQRIDAELGTEAMRYAMPEIALAGAVPHPPFERAWATTPFEPRPDFYPSLWQGIELLRYPGLPYCYEYRLELVARAAELLSDARIAAQPLPDLDFPGGVQDLTPTLDAQGMPAVDFLPTTYEALIDPVTQALAREPALDTELLRHAPDPDLQYELALVADGMVEPLAHVLRDAHTVAAASQPQRAWRAQPLSRRLQFLASAERDAQAPAGQRLRVRLSALPLRELSAHAPHAHSHEGDGWRWVEGRLLLWKPLDDQLLSALRVAWQRSESTALTDFAALERSGLTAACSDWLHGGPTLEHPGADSGAAWSEYDHQLQLTRADLDPDAFDRWLYTWLQRSPWRSLRLRTVLDDAVRDLLASSEAERSLTLRAHHLAGTDTPTLPPGISLLEAPARTGRWYSLGALTSDRLTAISHLSTAAGSAAASDHALRTGLQLPARAPLTLRLRRWRGTPLTGVSS